MHKAYLVNIKGRVTGVGFRYSTRNFVSRFPEVRGYVKNICEGQVEVQIQGAEYHVNEILEWLKHGPSYARVDDIKISEQPLSDNLEYFQIK